MPKFKVRFSRNNVDHNAEYFTVEADDYSYSTDGLGHSMLTFFDRDSHGKESTNKLFVPNVQTHILYIAKLADEEEPKGHKEGA